MCGYIKAGIVLLLQWLSQTANFSRGQEGTWYSFFFFFALGKTATVLFSWRRRTWVERKEWNVGWSDGGMDGKNTRYERLAILAEDFQTEQWSAAAQVQHSWSASDRDVALKYGNQCLITRVWSYAVNNKYKGQVVTVSHHPHCVISHMVILSAAAEQTTDVVLVNELVISDQLWSILYSMDDDDVVDKCIRTMWLKVKSDFGVK